MSISYSVWLVSCMSMSMTQSYSNSKSTLQILKMDFKFYFWQSLLLVIEQTPLSLSGSKEKYKMVITGLKISTGGTYGYTLSTLHLSYSDSANAWSVSTNAEMSRGFPNYWSLQRPCDQRRCRHAPAITNSFVIQLSFYGAVTFPYTCYNPGSISSSWRFVNTAKH